MILIENNHICCLQYQAKMLWGRAQLFLTNPRKFPRFQNENIDQNLHFDIKVICA